ncbi:hypothetical protein [Acidovorax sp. NO-1]|uniref:hypothetical protein n=1 Tax=Acidovorax sp. NO-1 TaxID=512030 RepID=UPI00268FD4B6
MRHHRHHVRQHAGPAYAHLAHACTARDLGARAVWGEPRSLGVAAPDLRALLRHELPRLEAAIWQESERETSDGMACNRGSNDCVGGRKGSMVLVPVSAQDERSRREILETTVLPRWVQRCGARCAQVWNQTIGPVRALVAIPAK